MNLALIANSLANQTLGFDEHTWLCDFRYAVVLFAHFEIKRSAQLVDNFPAVDHHLDASRCASTAFVQLVKLNRAF
jgi:hypothetical protein